MTEKERLSFFFFSGALNMSRVKKVIDSYFILQRPSRKQHLYFAYWNLRQPQHPNDTVSYNFLIQKPFTYFL